MHSRNERLTIGIFFFVEPQAGGAYQYCFSVLEAIKKLAYAVVIFSNSRNIKVLRDKYPFFIYKKWDKTAISGLWDRILLYFARREHLNLSLIKRISLSNYLFKRNGVDLLLFPSPSIYALLFNIPYIFTVYDLQHRINPQFPEVSSNGIWEAREFLYKNALAGASIILVDSNEGRKNVMEFYNVQKERIKVLPCIPPPNIERLREIKIDIIHRYNLPERFIFYPAQFWKHKNHLGLLKALSILRRKGIIVNAVFVGSEKNSYSEMKAAIMRMDLDKQVFILGFVSDEELVTLYKKAVALVMPTFFGPSNIPPLEAFVLGCPVAISDVPGISEQVGDAGLLFDLNNIEDMAEKIYRIWTDENLRQELIKKGYERVKELNIENYARQWENVIEEAKRKDR